MAFSPDGQRLASGGDDGKVVISEVATGKVLQTLQRKTMVFSVEFSADGESIMVGYAPPEPVARLWSLKTGDFIS